MKKLNFKLLILLLVAILGFYIYSVTPTNAADLFFLPQQIDVSEGEEFEVSLRLDAEETINAIESELSYSTDHLQIVGVDRSESVLDVWLERPSMSEANGTLHFIGGSSSGIGGSALEVLNIRFRSLQEGDTDITFNSGVVSAADGEGTDIFSEGREATVNISSSEVPETPIGGLTPVPEIEEELEMPATTTAPVAGLPDRPQLSVPLYPNQNRWHNHFGETRVFWGVPANVEDVALAVNDNPRYEPMEMIEGVCCGANLGVLSEGVNYIHVRFRNDSGWGETAHYRVAIDASPPLPFEVEISNPEGRNPQPEIRFETNDSISGILEYEVLVDNEDPIVTSKNRMVLPPQSPGSHLVQVRALDVAGNFVRDGVNFRILSSEGDGDRIRSTAGLVLLVIIVVGAGWFILRVHRSEDENKDNSSEGF